MEINLVQNIIINLKNKFIKRKNVRSLNNITKWVMFRNKKESLSQKSSRKFQESYRTTLQQSTRLYLDLNSRK